MLTDKFREAVMAQDITRVRMMMKNSLTMDLTFRQFQDMLDYAVSRVPGLIVKHDGTSFEGKANWNEIYASDIKVDLIDNFSSERIAHIKEVQRFVYADKVATLGVQTVQTSSTIQQSQHNTNGQMAGSYSQSSRKMDSRAMVMLITTIGVVAASILFGILRNATIVKIATTTVIATCVIGGVTYYLVKK